MNRIAAILLVSWAALAGSVIARSPYDLEIARSSVTAHSAGNLLLEQILLRRLVIESQSDLADAASHRLAESSLESGSYTETIRLLNSGDGAAEQNSPQCRRDRALMGEAYRLAGDATTAARILTEIVATAPNTAQPDDASLLAVKSLDAMGRDVDEIEHFRRASVYQFNRYWDEARQHYRLVKTTGDAAEALVQIGRGYSQGSEYEKAIPYFQSVIDNYADSQQAKDALLQTAAAYSRIGRTDEAIARYQQYIDKYPTGDKIDRAFLNIVDIDRDLGDDAHALEWCQKTEAAFTGKTPEALAIFDEAKIYASRSEWQNEIAALDRLKGRSDLGGSSQPGGTTSEEVMFMRGFALEQAGHRAEALKAYEYCPEQTLYTQWANQRQRQIAPNVQSPCMGLSPLGAPPFYYIFQDQYYAAIIARHAAARGIHPMLLFAIMQQESKFDPQARSNAAARGLMQFTHPQALKISRELGWTYFSDDELYSPEVSIALAAQYIADLDAMFPNQPEAVIASYNGGEDNVTRWMARAKSDDPERYVSEIVYGQTKDYVQKVMANYRVYQQSDDAKVPAR